MTKSMQLLAELMKEHSRTEKLIYELLGEMLGQNRWLTIEEAKEEYSLTASQIRYAAKTGRLRARKESERKIYYSSEDLARIAGLDEQSILEKL